MTRLSDFFTHIRQNEDGQSMVEFAICAPVLVLVLYALFYLSDLYILKSKVLIGARYAAWQVARGTHDAAAAEAGAADNFHYRFGGRDARANLSSLSDAPTSGSIDLSISNEASTGFSLGGVNDIVAGGLGALLGDQGSSQTTVGTLVYQLPVQLGPLDMSEFASGNTFAITANHYVDGNSWNGCAVRVHDLLGAIRNSITDFFDFF